LEAQRVVAVAVAVQGVRTPTMPVVALSAFSVRRADVRPTNWSGGRPVSRRPVSTRPVRSGCPDRQASGVRGLCIQAVRTALDPEYIGAAGRPRLGGEWGRRFTQPEVDRLLGRARELGVNLVDTAEC
jgi:hypothetical protein